TNRQGLGPGVLAPDPWPAQCGCVHVISSSATTSGPGNGPPGPSSGKALRGRYEWAPPDGVSRRCTCRVESSRLALWYPGRRRGRLGDQAQFACPGDGPGAVGRAQLGQDVADVLFDREHGDEQLLGDGLVRRARG